MKFNQWTLGLAALGVISLPAQAEEALNPVQTALASTTISGYVSTTANVTFGSKLPGTNVGHTVGRSYDGSSKQNGFNFDVAKLQIEKPLDESQWAAGYQLGLLFGPDANTYNTTSTGVNTSDFAIKDANLTLRAPVGNGLDFKIGYWSSPIGYEVFDSGNNPNYSRSFGYYIEPQQFTGVLVSYRVNDIISVSGGVANRGGVAFGPQVNTINARSGLDTVLSYLGSVAITAPESAGFLQGATLYGGVVDSGVGGTAGSDILNLYVGATAPTPVTGLVMGVCYDYRGTSQQDAPFVASSYANALSGYVSYKLTEKVKLNARVEYATGSNGTWWFSAVQDPNNQLLGVTGTVDYSLWANVLTRLEVRWDHSLRGNGVFNDGTDDNNVSLVLNAIYKF